jgi:acylphosphatase
VREAEAHGLTGCVWNTSDDAVELIAEGDADALGVLQRWLEHGPRLARVERVERVDLDGEPRYQDFRVAYAAPE